MVEALFVEQVAFNKTTGANGSRCGGAVPAGQAVVDHHVVAAVRQNARRVAANITGAARDEDPHQLFSTVNW